VNEARTLRDDALAKDQMSQANNELARNLCGYGEGQTSETPGTLYYLITQVRDLLLVAYDGNEEQLSTFGFNVVVSSSTSSGGGSPVPPDGVDISGRVTDVNSNGLSGATVSIYGASSGPGPDDPSTTTDANGNYSFSFENIPGPNDIVIEAEKEAYFNATIYLDVAPGNIYTNQDLVLNPNP
jgi:hypothetical protein